MFNILNIFVFLNVFYGFNTSIYTSATDRIRSKTVLTLGVLYSVRTYTPLLYYEIANYSSARRTRIRCFHKQMLDAPKHKILKQVENGCCLLRDSEKKKTYEILLTVRTPPRSSDTAMQRATTLVRKKSFCTRRSNTKLVFVFNLFFSTIVQILFITQFTHYINIIFLMIIYI